MGCVERTREIDRRRRRRSKLQKLRQQFGKASSRGEKQAIQEKARRVSPLINLEDAASR